MSVPNTSELDDDQIEALIRKLSAIKGSAPELIAALEAEASSRQANKGRGRGGRRGGGGTARTSRSHSYEDEEEEDEDDDEYEDDEEEDDEETDSEEEDEFDEDGPCVGYGYSDEVSVISEMTTPTVVSNLHVPAEERYDELARNKSNKPDLLSQVNRANAAKKKGGAAGLNSEKRKTYTHGLGKISETAETAAVTKPKTAKSGATKKTPARKPSGDGKARGLRRGNSPTRKTKKGGSTSGGNKKSNHSSTSGKSSKKSSGDNSSHNTDQDAFASDDWHKSLTSGDVKSTDDNGFPFSFGDTDNAFAESSNSFFKGKKGGGGDGGDPFDPFSNGDPFKGSDAFDSSNNAFTKSKPSKAASGRQRRSSTADKSTRSKNRETSPRRKGAR